MPITAPVVSAAILQANPTLVGPSWVQTTLAIGISVQIWAAFPGNVVLIGSVNGVVGGGVVIGKFLMPPIPLPVNIAVAGVALLGVDAQLAAAAVGLGVANALNASAAYVGTAQGAIGVDVSKVTFTNPATLIALLVANFAAQGLVGPLAAQFAVGVGNGIATMVLAGGGVGVATGAPGPSPGTGVSRSGLL
jgi:hypothetical protein